MLKLLQQQSNKDYLVVNDFRKATHFRRNGGALTLINRLTNYETNLCEKQVEEIEALNSSLGKMTVTVRKITARKMTAGEKEKALNRNKLETKSHNHIATQPAEEPLELPVMNFGKEEQKKPPTKKAAAIDDNVLVLPSMDFSVAKHIESQQEIQSHTTTVVGEENEELLELPVW